MSFEDTLKAVLIGGLPAVLDDPNAARRGVSPQGDNRVERTAPTGTEQDRDTFVNQLTNLRGVHLALFGVAVLVAAGALYVTLRGR